MTEEGIVKHLIPVDYLPAAAATRSSCTAMSVRRVTLAVHQIVPTLTRRVVVCHFVVRFQNITVCSG
jgi:hypothetical protein